MDEIDKMKIDAKELEDKLAKAHPKSIGNGSVICFLSK